MRMHMNIYNNQPYYVEFMNFHLQTFEVEFFHFLTWIFRYLNFNSKSWPKLRFYKFNFLFLQLGIFNCWTQKIAWNQFQIRQLSDNSIKNIWNSDYLIGRLSRRRRESFNIKVIRGNKRFHFSFVFRTFWSYCRPYFRIYVFTFLKIVIFRWFFRLIF